MVCSTAADKTKTGKGCPLHLRSTLARGFFSSGSDSTVDANVHQLYGRRFQLVAIDILQPLGELFEFRWFFSLCALVRVLCVCVCLFSDPLLLESPRLDGA